MSNDCKAGIGVNSILIQLYIGLFLQHQVTQHTARIPRGNVWSQLKCARVSIRIINVCLTLLVASSCNCKQSSPPSQCVKYRSKATLTIVCVRSIFWMENQVHGSVWMRIIEIEQQGMGLSIVRGQSEWHFHSIEKCHLYYLFRIKWLVREQILVES